MNLEHLCADVILNNFDRYCAAFDVKPKKILQLHIEFLQRKYGNWFLQKLSSNNMLKNEHVSFLLNKYSKEVDIRLFTECDFTTIAEKLQDIGSIVQKFSMVDVHRFLVDNFVSNIPKVQVLELKNTRCSDRTLRIISNNCLQLKILNLRGCSQVSDVGLRYLCDENLLLTELNIEETAITYRGVAHLLQNMPSIQHLGHENVPRAIFEAVGLNDTLEEDVSNNKSFSLVNIIIVNNPMRPENHLTHVLRACSMFCPLIEDLIVTDLMTEEQLNYCSAFHNLESATLSCSSVIHPKLCANDFIESIGYKLTALRLTSFSLSVQVLSSSCPNLESLALDYPQFEAMDSVDVFFPCLKVLNLERLLLDAQDNAHSVSAIISCSPKLEKFGILNSVFSSEIANAILNCSQRFTVLNFSSTLVEEQFIRDVLRVHTCLVKLIIENSGISSAQYDDILDMIEEMGNSNVDVIWADYSEVIRELFDVEYDPIFLDFHRQLLKL